MQPKHPPRMGSFIGQRNSSKIIAQAICVPGLVFYAADVCQYGIFSATGLKQIKQIDTSYSKEKNRTNERPSVQHLILKDDSTLLYHDYDTLRERFTDVYWIRSADEVYHMKHLYPYTDQPLGEFTDHFIRDPSGNLVVQGSTSIQLFPKMHFDSQKLLDMLIQPQELSLQELNQKRQHFVHAPGEKDAQVLSVFYYKIVIPWLCLLAVIGPAPFCIRFTRQLPVFFIYAFSVFGLVAVYLVMDAALVLGYRQVLPPAAAVLIPFTLFFGFFSFRYVRDCIMNKLTS